jgi:hypothetical protein
MGLTEPWVTLFSYEISGRDVILIDGDLFLVANLGMVVLFQIAILDIVFSLDSIITAVGLFSHGDCYHFGRISGAASGKGYWGLCR